MTSNLRQSWSSLPRVIHDTALALLLGFRWSLQSLRQPLGRRRFLILLAATLAFTYALCVFAYVRTVPDIGLRFAFGTTTTKAYPEFVVVPKDRSVPNLENVQVVQIGEQRIVRWLQLMRAIVDLNRHPVQAEFIGDVPDTSLTHITLNGERLVKVQYRESNGGPAQAVWCRLGPPPLGSLAPAILWFGLKAGLFVVGLFVFWKRPGDQAAAKFFVLCVVTFGAYIGGYHWWQLLTQPVLLLVFMGCSVLLPVVSLHFYLVFPRPKSFVVRRPALTRAAIYGPAGLFLVLLLVAYVFVRLLFHGGAAQNWPPQLDSVLDFIWVLFLVCLGASSLWYLASVLCLMHSYHTARDGTERSQVQCILFGALAAIVPLGYSLYLAFFDKQSLGSGGATWPMFAASACFTIAFTVGITRYRLMQVNELISSGMVYFLISTAAGLVYYALYALVFLVMLVVGSRAVSGPTFSQALWVIGSTLVLVLFLDLLRGRFKAALDRHFHREKHQLDRTLKRLSQAVEQLVDPESLARRLLGTCTELLGATHGAVYLRAGNPPLFLLTDHLGVAPPLTELSSGCPLVECVRTGNTLLLRPSDAAGWWAGRLGDGEGNGSSGHGMPQTTTPLPQDPARRQLHRLGGEVAQALIHEDQLLALLILGPRARGPYRGDELNLLAAIAQITAMALVGAEGRRTIEALNRDLQAKVEKIGEQQRRILALQSQLMKLGSGVRNQKAEIAAHSSQPPPEAGPAPPASSENVPAGIVGSSPQICQLLQLVKKVSSSDLAVLLRGESGTGKELLARAIHDSSPRSGRAYVKVHCAALSPSLLESELFGHVKGAFTGAHRDKVGRFELADGGTLFLDEIGDISLEVQTKLLRVLQEKTFERVGSSEPVRVDVRMIAATHQDLEDLIQKGRFRQDLFYRLNGFPITVPPLRERREDIPELALHFLQQCSKRCGKDGLMIDDDAMMSLRAYAWPGNIRQLENVIERAVVIVEGMTISPRELPSEFQQVAEEPRDEEQPAAVFGIDGERAERARTERERLVRALAAADGNKTEAARSLGLHRSTFVSRLKKHGLS